MKSLLLLKIGLLSSVLANPPPTVEEKNLWSSIGTFGHTLSQRLSALNANGNTLVSPASVATALSVALVGARGSTKQEMLQAMSFQSLPEGSIEKAFSSMLGRKHENVDSPDQPTDEHTLFTLLAANRLYVRSQFAIKEDYKADVKRNFNADALNVDFVNNGTKIAADINAFVAERTKGLIKNILKQPLSSQSVIAIINTLYFKGYWSKRMAEIEAPTVFNEGCGDLQSQHTTRLAITSHFKYADSATLQAQIILLPYTSGDINAEMLILLPKREHNCKMQAWFDQVSWNDIKNEIKKMTMTNVALNMPAFELNGRYNLEETLPSLGMPLAFSPFKANFTGISDNQLNINQVIHQTKMIVTRYGTEAAAAVVMAINRLSAEGMNPPVPFIIDRSFYLSIIYHQKSDNEHLLPLFTAIVNKV